MLFKDFKDRLGILFGDEDDIEFSSNISGDVFVQKKGDLKSSVNIRELPTKEATLVGKAFRNVAVTNTYSTNSTVDVCSSSGESFTLTLTPTDFEFMSGFLVKYPDYAYTCSMYVNSLHSITINGISDIHPKHIRMNYL